MTIDQLKQILERADDVTMMENPVATLFKIVIDTVTLDVNNFGKRFYILDNDTRREIFETDNKDLELEFIEALQEESLKRVEAKDIQALDTLIDIIKVHTGVNLGE